MGTHITMRPINDLDVNAVAEIDEKITDHEDISDWERRVFYYMSRDPDVALVAEQGGKVVGFMLGEIRSGEFGLKEPSGWIGVVGVDPAARGQAIGRKLLAELMQRFQDRGAMSVRTLVDSDSQAQLLGFFEKSDFAATPMRMLERRL
ncbi:MAG: GNAT family N-acetyltransferase [Planctomycetota bacterium]|nr:GNAT family N-acetyltransferase [Planctomycetota bacterium]